MKPFDRLNTAVQFHIVNSLGWPNLRPLQEQAIAPILGDQHVLLLAPTAGGKTEAAIFPILSRMLDEDWRGLSVIYLCPIKALLNNLESRLDRYAQLLGRRVAVWHGDVGSSARREIIADRPDILLTTPESLEVMLITRQKAHRALFGGLRVVVVDEIHAFAGDDRGWHLLAVMQRVAALSAHAVQRIGLSATVGNPDQILDWLNAGADGARTVVTVEAQEAAADVQIDYVGNIKNAAIVISRLHRGEKRLVFCDSRARVEELASELREMKVQTFVSHSSLSVDERRAAETAFSEARNCVIVATSTLELGIDVGDLDRIIQIDATGTVSSFLQRLGRTGRREGSTRNCLFLATSPEALIQACGLVLLWRRGFVEPTSPPPLPYHVLAQQILAVLISTPGISRPTLWKRVAVFCATAGISRSDFDRLLDYMSACDFLFEDQGLLSVGPATDRQFGQKNFLRLFSVFESPPLFTVFHGAKQLGEVDEMTFLAKERSETILSLAGRPWKVTRLEWAERRAFVEPAETKGKSRWLGSGKPLSWELAQSIKAVLAGEDVESAHLSVRAAQRLQNVRQEFEWLDPGAAPLVEDRGQVTWWTFGGTLLNDSIAAQREALSLSSTDELAIHFENDVVIGKAHRLVTELTNRPTLKPPPANSFKERVKFSVALPDQLMAGLAEARLSAEDAWESLKKQSITLVRHKSESE